MLRTLPALLALPFLLGSAPGAGAQEAASLPSPDAALTERDSARLVREARSEQARFERVRRNNLPWAWGGGGGHCDERIGRFCLTYGDGTPDREPEPEAEEIGEARERLILSLDAAARQVPGDMWISGQRVRYLVEARRHADARAAAAECRAAAWWCTGLEAFAAHYAGEPAVADSLFSRMLPAMPEDERRRWTDLGVLLDSCVRGQYRRLRGAERERFEERFWRAADPFQTRPGNEVRSEHLARNVWDRLQDRAKSTDGLVWGDDLEEILLRFGWPQGWERIRPRVGQFESPGMVSHYADGGRRLLPPCEDGVLGQGDWDQESHRSRTSYAIPMRDSTLKWVRPVDYQVAVFRRGDSALVVTAYGLPRDSVPAGAAFQAALSVVQGADELPRVTPFPTGGMGDVLVAEAAPGPVLLSLEAVDPAVHRAARVRYGIEIPVIEPGLPAVSDLLLLHSPDPLPDSLPPAVALSRRDTRLRPGERVGVYWEVYGLRPGQPEALGMSLRLVEEGAGWLKRLGRRIGLLDRVPPVRIRWQEHPAGLEMLPRSLAVQIPPDLSPGSYALELTLSLPGREPMTVRRVVQVEERDEVAGNGER